MIGLATSIIDHGNYNLMMWRRSIANLVPRGTWSYGSNLCDGIFNVETVLLRQLDVINYGKEQCHHLTVCVVGPPEAGKTSLIRKLAGEYGYFFESFYLVVSW